VLAIVEVVNWKGEPVRLAPGSCAGSGGFVPDGRPGFVRQFRRYFVHLMCGSRVLGGLLQDVLVGLAASHEITVSYHLVASQYFGHRTLLPWNSEVKMLLARIEYGDLWKERIRKG
jgi:hypothetical protein